MLSFKSITYMYHIKPVSKTASKNIITVLKKLLGLEIDPNSPVCKSKNKYYFRKLDVITIKPGIPIKN